MNTVVLVGRLTGNPEVTVTENGKHITKILLAVNRNYKNADGIYETDFIRCVLWNGIAGATSEFCKVGDVVGIKGRLQTSVYETEDKKKNYIRRERCYGKYERSFYLGDLESDNIEASFTDGILKIVVPKKEESENKKFIEIK